MILLASKDTCTACGACAYVCPRHCIRMSEDEIGQTYPIIDFESCIECHSCQKICPVIKPVDGVNTLGFRKPIKTYAAWSNDEEERRTSASGGIASEVYKYAISNGYKAAGAVQNSDFTVTMSIAHDIEGIKPFKNSKYVFSSAYSLYPQLKKLLKYGLKVVVIGLPCQIAAIRKIFKDNENLLLFDVVCHGVTPFRYLRQHINILERRLGKKAYKMSFRDPYAYTYTYTFTLYSADNEMFYAKRTRDGDTYQYGYHRMISYRSNCYNCRFAQDMRISDATLGDYKGLGKLAPSSVDERKVSCILVNTEKGKHFIEKLIEEDKIFAEDRPILEPIEGDSQLRHPSIKSPARIDFEKYISIYEGDFERTMNVVMKRVYRRQRIDGILKLPFRIAKKIYKVLFQK